MRQRLGSAILGVAVLAAAVLGASPALAHAPAVLAPCPGVPGLPSARCGSIEVPLDRANPSAGSTTVAFALAALP
jgi:hypothetical protein